MTGFDSLSGTWSGVYDYPFAHDEPVPFTVVLIDIAGQLSGVVTEPNTMRPELGAELIAYLSGHHDGTTVDVVKRYEADDAIAHTVRYEGTLNRALTRVEGTWTTQERGGGWSGPFIMQRDDGAAAEESGEAEAELSTSRALILRTDLLAR
ncbi:MAG: hypothetical protein AAFV62_01465 [Pseudomonadota bacterium]